MSGKTSKTALKASTRKVLSKIYHSIKGSPANAPHPLLYPHRLELVGGKLVCLDLIPEGSTIVSGGIGNDIVFETALIAGKKTRVIGIDPTTTAEHYIQRQIQDNPDLPHKFTYLKKAVSHNNEPIRLFFGNDDFMSSVSSQHRDTDEKNSFLCESVTLEELHKQYTDISYLKLDIEGAEYAILNKTSSLTIPQISIEFHHHCSTEYSLHETIDLIQKICAMGYDAIDYGSFHGADRQLPMYAAKWTDLNCELLFIRKKS